MIYKNQKEYDQLLKDLNKVLNEAASKAKRKVESQETDQAPSKTEKTVRHTQSR